MPLAHTQTYRHDLSTHIKAVNLYEEKNKKKCISLNNHDSALSTQGYSTELLNALNEFV